MEAVTEDTAVDTEVATEADTEVMAMDIADTITAKMRLKIWNRLTTATERSN